MRQFFLKSWIFLFLSLIVACSDDDESVVAVENPEFYAQILEAFDEKKVDSLEHVITISESSVKKGILTVGNMNLPKGYVAYIAADSDKVDPEINWDMPVKKGTKLVFSDKTSLELVILDEKNCVVDVWLLNVPKSKSSSSKETLSSSSMSSKMSSASKDDESSSSKMEDDTDENVQSDSSEEAESEDSSSSKKDDEETSGEDSSSSEEKSSSSEVNSSSSEEKSSSSDADSSSSEEGLSSSDADSSSSEEESSSSEEVSSSSLSNEKMLKSIDIKVDGKSASVNRNDFDRILSLNLSSSSELELAQVRSISVSERAVATVPVNKNLEFTKASDFVYELAFEIIAEDGSKDIWKIQANVPKGVLLKNFKVKDGSVSIDGRKVYVEVPYDTDLHNLTVLPMDTVADLINPVEMKFVDDFGELNTYMVVAGKQLPGTNFKERDPSGFWATTSDAMANSVITAAINVTADENLTFSQEGATLTSKVISGSFISIDGAWKLAGGFYFTGEYNGTTSVDIYDQGNTGGTPSTGISNILNDMVLGRAFNARPMGFDVEYSYVHKAGSNDEFPQKCLIYVMLESADNQIVAAGVITEDADKNMGSVHVDLTYGSDANLLNSGFPIKPGLSVGKADEEVAYIHVMFASSAYAHNVSGSAFIKNESNYRGGEGSELTVKNFKLVY